MGMVGPVPSLIPGSHYSAGQHRGCTGYEDFRDLLARPDIDAVVIAKPDHWHVPIALAAARAAKNMYVEKPLGLSMEQKQTLRAAIHRYGNIFQYATQQRSFNTHCAFACELVRNGYLGRIEKIHVDAPAGSNGGSTHAIPAPEGFDYEMWLGPARWSAFTIDRCTSAGSWFVHDNSLGFVAGWGAHPLDVMHWGYPQIATEYEGTGQIPAEGLFDTITNWNVRGHFASGVEFLFKDGSDKTAFFGTEGWVAASRGGIDANPKSLLTVKLRSQDTHLLQSTNHYQNFVDAVRLRTTPASPIDSAVQSDFVSHLSDMAMRTGRKIQWDPVSETIVGDERLNRLRSRPMRSLASLSCVTVFWGACSRRRAWRLAARVRHRRVSAMAFSQPTASSFCVCGGPVDQARPASAPPWSRS